MDDSDIIQGYFGMLNVCSSALMRWTDYYILPDQAGGRRHTVLARLSPRAQHVLAHSLQVAVLPQHKLLILWGAGMVYGISLFKYLLRPDPGHPFLHNRRREGLPHKCSGVRQFPVVNWIIHV